MKTIVNGLWLGDETLGALEKLTLKSFVEMGAEFHLWGYGNIKDKLPKGVILRNGEELIPKEKIFRYPSSMLLGFGANSYVGFSEIFRYKVLYEIGGWWSDMDVVCLKPLSEIEDPYWFRFHGVLSVVGNIMKCPAKSELMKRCYERAVEEVNSKQDDWHHAIRILCYYIEYLGLSNYIHKYDCNLDRINNVMHLYNQPETTGMVHKNWRFIHWMNSVLPKEYSKDSVLDNFLNKYNIKNNIQII
jgi:hypothetical protein